MTLLQHEWKLNIKSLLIWSICVGFSCFGCICLFGGLEETMDQMADAYAQMGAFSTALGLDKISVSTMEGFYATEVALVYAIGGAMFGAMMGASMIAKEEEGHTSEFLNTLPLGRGYIVFWKYISMLTLIFLFNLICVLWEAAGFFSAGALFPLKDFFLGKLVLFHEAQMLMHVEVGSVCFLISALCRKKQVGAALGLAMLLYGADLMCRIVPDIENLKYVTPYYFSNAADIFISGKIEGGMAGICMFVIVLAAAGAAAIYQKRDLAA